MNTLDTAHRWIESGFSVIPITYRSKRPAFDALRMTGSMTAGDVSWSIYKERPPTPAELSIWFTGPKRNLGLVTGYNGLVVLDFDTLEMYEMWRGWAADSGGSARDCMRFSYKVHSARGVHVYITCSEPVEPYRIADIDIKARWGYVLAPPSMHPSGVAYQGAGDRIIHCEHFSDVFPLVKPAPELAVLDIPVATDPWEAADHAVECGGMRTIEQIKAHVRIEDILHLTGITRNTMIICPFHADKNPSMSVDIGRQTVHCYGCGFHGDVLDVYAALHKVTNREAIAALC